MAEQTLYVVFHGLIQLVEYPDHFKAILIEMPEHRVAAGHWLTERTIPQGDSLQLNGVATGGTAGLDPTINLVFTTASLVPNALAKYRYADITLPKPRKTYSFHTGDISTLVADPLTGSSQTSSKKYSATQVFEYEVTGDFDDISLVQQSSFEWVCLGETALPAGNRMAVLHIVNEPETEDVWPNHTVDEFNRSTEIAGADLKLNHFLPFPGSALEQPPDGLGLIPQELVPLGARAPFILLIVEPLRRPPQPPPAQSIGTSKYCGPLHVAIRS